VITYIFTVRKMMKLQNLVVTVNPVDAASEVVITYPKHARKLADEFLGLLPVA